MNEQGQLIPMGTGERLGRERRKRKLSLEETAAALRIPVDVLQAIEADELERYAAVYRRGYFQAYARFLGIEADVTEELLAGVEEESPGLRSIFPRAARQNHADRWLRATSYVLASLLIGTLAWQFTHEAVRLSQGNTPAAGQPGPDAVNSGQVQGTTMPARHVNASIAALEDIRSQRPAGANSAGEQAWSAVQQVVESDQEETDGRHLLRITTSADSWVEIVDAQSRQLELDLVRGGSDKEYLGQAPFRILFGRASAVQLFLDGEPVDTGPYTSGDVTQMTLEEILPAGDGQPDANGG